MKITYKNTITVDEVNAIRKSMGWRQQHPDQLQDQLDSVDLIISAYVGNIAVGVAIGQGYVLIMPEYQYQGIENEFMRQIIDYTHSKLKPGYGTQIDIRAFGDKQIALYESLGFQISTAEQRGVSMHICVTNQIELTDKMFKQMEYKEDTDIYSQIRTKEPITKGWSEDKKYCVTTTDGTKYLLRVTPIARYETRKALFSMLERVAALNVPMCVPMEFGTCDDGVYALHSWIDGEDLETVLPKLTEAEQYVLGLKSGEIARKMHSIPAPETQEEWETRFNRKTDIKIQKYRECGLRFDGDEYVLSYLEQNRHLLKNRPLCFQHGDFHVGNMMVENGELRIIDFDRYDFGDPWEEFNRIVWSAAASPHFTTGQLRGYFGGEPPMEFFKLLAFYIASNTLSSIYWAVPFGSSDLDTMMKQAQDVLTWFDNMQNPVPTWFLSETQIYLQNPCRFISTAYWKKDYYTKPEDVQIFHEKDLDLSIYSQNEGTRYFRLIHYPQKHYENVLPDGYYYRVVNLSSETPVAADFINRCYPGSSINTDEVYKWTQFPVFDNDLWVFICNKQNQSPVALGIADFDNELGEGSLEWIQVLPEYRGYGFGKKIVLELLSRLKEKASFVTVSGEADNPTNPESLYRKCGFIGEDVWYVFRNRRMAKA